MSSIIELSDIDEFNAEDFAEKVSNTYCINEIIFSMILKLKNKIKIE